MLSGYGYFPPIETVITPHVGTAVKAGLAPTRKRHAWSKLSPHHYVVYPLPPVVEPVDVAAETEQAAVRSALAQQRRQAKSRLFPHHHVVYQIVQPADATAETQLVAVATSVGAPRHVLYMAGVRPPQFVGVPPAAPVETTVRAHLVASHSGGYPPARRRPRSVLAKPLYVAAPAATVAAMGGIGIWLAPQTRTRTLVILFPPAVVVPPPAEFIEDHLRVVLVFNRRGR